MFTYRKLIRKLIVKLLKSIASVSAMTDAVNLFQTLCQRTCTGNISYNSVAYRLFRVQSTNQEQRQHENQKLWLK